MSAVARRRRQRLEDAYVELMWRRWADDPAAFMADCVQVPAGEKLSTGQGRAPLQLFDYQQDTLDIFRDNRFVVVLKARQLGLTTLAMSYALWMLLFRPGSNIVLVSKNQPTANSALELLDFMWQFLPGWVRGRAPTMENDAATLHTWRFDDGMMSRIASYAATDTVAAGQTASLVIWDEAALAKQQEDVLRTLLPTTDAGGSMIVFSTARGGHNAFAQLYRDAERGDSEFVPVFHPWWVSRLLNSRAEAIGVCGSTPCPLCVDWGPYEAKKRAMRREPWRFFAEYPSDPEEAFRQSGRSRFPGLPPIEEFEEFPVRGRLEWDGRGGIRLVEDEDGPLRVRRDALSGVPAGHRAVLAVDPASGGGLDFTAMTAGWMDRDGVPQRVAFWHDNLIEPAVAAVHADMLGRWLSDDRGREALLVVEKQGGYGDTILHELRETLGYRNLYVHTYTGHRARRQETTYGMPMTPSRRPLVIDALAKWLRFDGGSVPMEGVDPLLRYELGAFVVRDDGKVQADVGMTDDLVMSAAIWVYVLETAVGAAATSEVKVGGPGVQTFSVAGMFAEVEEVRRAQEQRDRRYGRRLARRMR